MLIFLYQRHKLFLKSQLLRSYLPHQFWKGCIFISYVWMTAFMCIFVLYACMVSLEVQRGITSPQLVTMCWEFNLCSLQGRQVLLTSEPSLQPLGYKHIFKLILKCKAWQMEGEVSFSVNIHTARGLCPWGSMEPFKWLCSSLSDQTSVCVFLLPLFTLGSSPQLLLHFVQ